MFQKKTFRNIDQGKVRVHGRKLKKREKLQYIKQQVGNMPRGRTSRAQPRSLAGVADAKGKRKDMASSLVVPSSCLGFIASTGFSIISSHGPKIRMYVQYSLQQVESPLEGGKAAQFPAQWRLLWPLAPAQNSSSSLERKGTQSGVMTIIQTPHHASLLS